MAFLIGVILLIVFILGFYLYIKRKIKDISVKYLGGNSIRKIIEEARLEDEEVPKSLASMESIYLDIIKKDFPEVNINELKRKSEALIMDVYIAIEEKNPDKIENEKIRNFVRRRIKDLGDITVEYKDMTINKTVVSKYEKNSGVATIRTDTSFWYYEIKGNSKKKVQDRVRCEYIYVIDSSKIADKDKQVYGISCPNCGSPITSLGYKSCSYCGSRVVDVVSKVFLINDLVRY